MNSDNKRLFVVLTSTLKILILKYHYLPYYNFWSYFEKFKQQNILELNEFNFKLYFYNNK